MISPKVGVGRSGAEGTARGLRQLPPRSSARPGGQVLLCGRDGIAARVVATLIHVRGWPRPPATCRRSQSEWERLHDVPIVRVPGRNGVEGAVRRRAASVVCTRQPLGDSRLFGNDRRFAAAAPRARRGVQLRDDRAQSLGELGICADRSDGSQPQPERCHRTLAIGQGRASRVAPTQSTMTVPAVVGSVQVSGPPRCREVEVALVAALPELNRDAANRGQCGRHVRRQDGSRWSDRQSRRRAHRHRQRARA